MKYLGLIFFSTFFANASNESLKEVIESIIKTKHALVGVAISVLETGETVYINQEKHYPMQSVYKFHLSLAILKEVDDGKLSLEQKIHIKRSDLNARTWSPMQKKYPKANIDLSLSEILKYTISQSDNNGCDILFKLIGGPKKVNAYVHSLGIKDVSIVATEQQMQSNWNIQFKNYTSASAMTDLLSGFYFKRYLSEKTNAFLMQLMLETITGPKRIKGLLPDSVKVAHKTGTSGTNDDEVSAATNDIGIIFLPNGKHLAIAVFVSDSFEELESDEEIIAEISKAAYENFMKK
ncbi:MAG: class A beta-lactamase, subclass A2 [Candidatus Kapabacteria bacterium]|nr:class A beta-lactamase, subclass A2 [Candidatus Kapabacteria bacterium]